MVLGYFGFGHIIYVSLLFTNAIAILNEERFLAKIGWSTRSAQNVNSGFGAVQNPNLYDTNAFGGSEVEGVSIKTKLINLISATRTLMRIPLIVLNVVMCVQARSDRA